MNKIKCLLKNIYIEVSLNQNLLYHFNENVQIAKN